ncbi:7783_t:CDS:2 [Funneliformis geosporum]|uniref:14616_t:CDS:1 n=1 Tax=Funneliformis geosporum TaxID=1117311 RepID=A0A9W4STA0_9GLOM|nr:7783_t:CDS:2 [Funneliformis geosporum]CAI2179717.1 14616_t:CDS:2 [Funneliformis geosporum]
MTSVSLLINPVSLTVDEQYTSELEGYLTEDDFYARIALINETTKFYISEHRQTEEIPESSELTLISELANKFNSIDNQKGINWRYTLEISSTYDSNSYTHSIIIEIDQPSAIGVIIHNYQGETSNEQRSIKNTDSNESTPLL